MLGFVKPWLALLQQVSNLPRVRIDLMLGAAERNHPFFLKLTRDFHQSAIRPHRKLPIVGQMEIGFSVCTLGTSPYSERLESSARRNIKKALRNGYRVSEIDFNAHLDAVTQIHQSTSVRQGKKLPTQLTALRQAPHQNPASQSPTHDYPYHGVFKNGTLVAYASCLVAGELAAIQTIFGHADHLSEGVVPLLIAHMGDNLPLAHPELKYFAYGSFYGATESMRRFKRKFLFTPHRVTWVLGD